MRSLILFLLSSGALSDNIPLGLYKAIYNEASSFGIIELSTEISSRVGSAFIPKKASFPFTFTLPADINSSFALLEP